jgi:hypothetical protein
LYVGFGMSCFLVMRIPGKGVIETNFRLELN